MINHYLHYGYLPPRSVSRKITNLPKNSKKAKDYSIAGASEAFDRAIENSLSAVAFNGYCIIPLSGGWDSRALLGAALERFPRNKIKTMSFGAPGLLDFDIGGKISKEYNLQHCAVDLSSCEVTWDGLSNAVKESPWTYAFSCYFNKIGYDEIGLSKNDFVLSGFLGEALSGGHLNNNQNLDAAADTFAKKQRQEKAIWLPQATYNPLSALPNLPDSDWSHGEVLDLGVRQSRCIAPIVTPLRHWDNWGGVIGEFSSGTTMLAPFADPTWAKYWQLAPCEARKNQQLYIAMLKSKYPKLFAMPSKYTLGVSENNKVRYKIAKLKRQVQHHFGKRLPKLGIRYTKGDNYIDFATAIRQRRDYQDVTQQAIDYLKSTASVPWIDLDLLYEEHLGYKADYSRALMLLVGLALNLKHNPEN